jgi:hypothetical protein
MQRTEQTWSFVVFMLSLLANATLLNESLHISSDALPPKQFASPLVCSLHPRMPPPPSADE